LYGLIIHYKIKENGRYVSKVLGVNLSGRKEILGWYLSENEGINFCLQVLSNRGIEDILIASVDGLKGFPEAIRRCIIYTTNIIESVHRQFRKLTKTKEAFPNENSLLKLLYMRIQNAQKKWTMPMRNWSLTISQLAILFEGKLDKALEL